MSDDDPTTSAPLPGSWDEDDADAIRESKKGRGALIAIVVVVLLIVAGAAAFFITNGSDPERAWPDDVNGRPSALGSEKDTTAAITSTDAKQGVYIWSGFDGWHLWVVTAGDSADLKGTITSSDDIKHAAPSSPGDGTVTVDGKKVEFTLKGSKPVLGLDFEPGFSKKLTFTIEGPEGPIDADIITLGPDHPATANPVVVVKAEKQD